MLTGFCLPAQRAPILPNHAHLLPRKTSVLDRHAEERIGSL
jgi:hypothetical protein